MDFGVVYWRCADCEAAPVPKPDPIQHDATCPHITVPEAVSETKIVEAAHEMAALYRRTASAPWFRAMLRLVVMCERGEASTRGSTRGSDAASPDPSTETAMISTAGERVRTVDIQLGKPTADVRGAENAAFSGDDGARGEGDR